ncbi:unnamed protein product [Triticum turgidum subsp. durum]|uniref:F-box domain-containing protein n=1 Tax=Triticum turgidum subsp. durum TaxID=4567 RepID=A0A9R1APU8_TRITD|nr:unnamed protein product [Triticum turgidum subsp. durum]
MDDVAAAEPEPKKLRQDEQEPPASREGGGGGEENLDHVSRMPDNILGSVISLLSTKEAARTRVLSSRWRHLWRSAPLNLVVDRRLSGRERDRVAIVSKILATHHGPACRFSLAIGAIRLRRDLYAKFDGWFRSPALDGLEELQFYGGCNPLPPSALRLAPTLRVASFRDCGFPDVAAVPALRLPRLKHLKLPGVAISEEALHHLLAGCTALESLELQGNGLSTVRIVSPTLRSIAVYVSYYYKSDMVLQELVIEDAPCLERLIPLDSGDVPMTITVIAAPKLTVLGYLSSQIYELVIGTIIVKEMIPVSLTASMRTVKVLVLESIGPNLDTIARFLRCFPCMEKLYIQSRFRKDMKNVGPYDILIDPIECLNLHLRAIIVNTYRGMQPDVNFAKFFVLNAKVLKVMKFGVCGTYNEKWMANQQRRLQLDKRASRDARFDFERDVGGCWFSNKKHTHDLWIADPFDSSLCNCC